MSESQCDGSEGSSRANVAEARIKVFLSLEKGLAWLLFLFFLRGVCLNSSQLMKGN